jgi:prevent-host-death family protein
MYISMYTGLVTKSYSIAAARSHLAEIVSEVEAGHDVELTRRGKRVAVVVHAARHDQLAGAAHGFAQAYARFRDQYDLAEIGLDDGWATALRTRERGRDVEL